MLPSYIFIRQSLGFNGWMQAVHSVCYYCLDFCPFSPTVVLAGRVNGGFGVYTPTSFRKLVLFPVSPPRSLQVRNLPGYGSGTDDRSAYFGLYFLRAFLGDFGLLRLAWCVGVAAPVLLERNIVSDVFLYYGCARPSQSLCFLAVFSRSGHPGFRFRARSLFLLFPFLSLFHYSRLRVFYLTKVE